MKYFGERKVFYSENHKNQKAFHIELMKKNKEILGEEVSIRRHYGFLIDSKEIKKNHFVKKGEYIEFDKTEVSVRQSEETIIFPAGRYLCSIVKVIGEKADFTILNTYLERHKIQTEYVIADEIGLQLFDYTAHEYFCEIKIYMQ